MPVATALEEARARIAAAGFDKLDYVSAVDPETLSDLPGDPAQVGAEGRILAAAWMGTTRLIDNMGFQRGESCRPSATADLVSEQSL